MDLKEKIHITSKNHISFSWFFFFPCSSFQTRKDLALSKSYDATV